MTIEMAGKPGSYRPSAVPRYQPTAGMRKATVSSLHKLAADLREKHDGMGSHLHVTDAARALARGDHEGAQRHLNAAIANMTPQSLYRHGYIHDEDYHQAKVSMDNVHRHLLLVKDIHETHLRNQELPRASDLDPDSEKVTDPNAPIPEPRPGVGRQRAMNAPESDNSGGPDKSVAQPKSVTEWRVTKQIAASNPSVDLAHRYNPLQPRGRDGKWTNTGLGVGSRALEPTGKHDPASMIAVGGGRKNWADEASQMPDPQEIRNHPEAARQARLITPRRVLQARMDETRISGGQKPLHPELAEIWPHIYGKAGVTPQPGTLSVPRAARAKKDPMSVSGLPSGNYPYMRAAVSQKVLKYQDVTGMANRRNGVELSADTPRLATQPHPFGKPGGPGLWGVKGMQLPPYVQNIAHALLRTGRAKTESQAIAMARGATKRWARGGGNVRPEVRAASAATGADWEAKRARAHAQSNTRQRAITLAAWEHERRGKGGKWISVGTPEHAAALRSLADRADLQGLGRNSGVSGNLRRAADKIDKGDTEGARRHVALASSSADDYARTSGWQNPDTVRRISGLTTAVSEHRAAMEGRSYGSARPGRVRAPGAGSPVLANSYRNTVNLTGTAEGASKDPRIPPGNVGAGRFGTAGQAKPGTAKPGAKKPMTAAQKAAAHKAHVAHVAHVAHMKTPAGKKQALLQQAAGYRSKADALIAKRDAMRKGLASASGKTSSGQKGAKTTSQAGSKTSSTAPSTTKSSAPPAKSSTAPAKSSGTAAKTPASSAKASVQSQIAALNKQIVALQAQYHQAMAQAKAL